MERGGEQIKMKKQKNWNRVIAAILCIGMIMGSTPITVFGMQPEESSSSDSAAEPEVSEPVISEDESEVAKPVIPEEEPEVLEPVVPKEEMKATSSATMSLTALTHFSVMNASTQYKLEYNPDAGAQAEKVQLILPPGFDIPVKPEDTNDYKVTEEKSVYNGDATALQGRNFLTYTFSFQTAVQMILTFNVKRNVDTITKIMVKAGADADKVPLNLNARAVNEEGKEISSCQLEQTSVIENAKELSFMGVQMESNNERMALEEPIMLYGPWMKDTKTKLAEVGAGHYPYTEMALLIPVPMSSDGTAIGVKKAGVLDDLNFFDFYVDPEVVTVEGKQYWKYTPPKYLGSSRADYYEREAVFQFIRLQTKLESYDEVIKLAGKSIQSENIIFEYTHLGKKYSNTILGMNEIPIGISSPYASSYVERVQQGEVVDWLLDFGNHYRDNKNGYPMNREDVTLSVKFPAECLPQSFSLYKGEEDKMKISSVSYFLRSDLDHALTVPYENGQAKFPEGAEIEKIEIHFSTLKALARDVLKFKLKTAESSDNKDIYTVLPVEIWDDGVKLREQNLKLELQVSKDILMWGSPNVIVEVTNFCDEKQSTSTHLSVKNANWPVLVRNENNDDPSMRAYKDVVIKITEPASQNGEALSTIAGIGTDEIEIGSKDGRNHIEKLEVHYRTNLSPDKDIIEELSDLDDTGEVFAFKLQEGEYIQSLELHLGTLYGGSSWGGYRLERGFKFYFSKGRNFFANDKNPIPDQARRELNWTFTSDPVPKKISTRPTLEMTVNYERYQTVVVAENGQTSSMKSGTGYQGTSQTMTLTSKYAWKRKEYNYISPVACQTEPKLYLEVSKDFAIKGVAVRGAGKCQLLEKQSLDNGNVLLIYQAPMTEFSYQIYGKETSTTLNFDIDFYIPKETEIGKKQVLFASGISMDGFDDLYNTEEFADSAGTYQKVKVNETAFPKEWDCKEKGQVKGSDLSESGTSITVNKMSVGALDITPGCEDTLSETAVFYDHQKPKLFAKAQMKNLSTTPIYNYKATYTLPNTGGDIEGSDGKGGIKAYQTEYPIFLTGLATTTGNLNAVTVYYNAAGEVLALDENSSEADFKQVHSFSIEIGKMEQNELSTANIPLGTDFEKTGAVVHDLDSYIGGKFEYAKVQDGSDTTATTITPAKYIFTSYDIQGALGVDTDENGVFNEKYTRSDITVSAQIPDGTVVSQVIGKDGQYAIKVNADVNTLQISNPDGYKLTKNKTGTGGSRDSDFDRETNSVRVDKNDLISGLTYNKYDAVYLVLPGIKAKDITIVNGEKETISLKDNVTGAKNQETRNKYQLSFTGPGSETVAIVKNNRWDVSVQSVNAGSATYTVKVTNTLGDESADSIGNIEVTAPAKELTLQNSFEGPANGSFTGISAGTYKLSIVKNDSKLQFCDPSDVEANRLTWGSEKAKNNFGIKAGELILNNGMEETAETVTVDNTGTLGIAFTSANALPKNALQKVQFLLSDVNTGYVLYALNLSLDMTPPNIKVTVPLSITVCTAKDGSMAQPDKSKMFVENLSNFPVDISVDQHFEKDKMTEREDETSIGEAPDIGKSNEFQLAIRLDEATSVPLGTSKNSSFKPFGTMDGTKDVLNSSKVHFDFTSKNTLPDKSSGKDLYYTLMFKAKMRTN